MKGIRAAPIVGMTILGEALAANLLLRADETQVWFLGHAIPWQCALRRQYGLPCPTCGLTRSVVMSLHGEFARAWDIAPAGPIAVAGAIAIALALICLSWAKRPARAEVWIRRAGVAYGGVTAALWLGGWAMAFSQALKSR